MVGCQLCGADVAGAAACPRCGEPVGSVPPPPPPASDPGDHPAPPPPEASPTAPPPPPSPAPTPAAPVATSDPIEVKTPVAQAGPASSGGNRKPLAIMLAVGAAVLLVGIGVAVGQSGSDGSDTVSADFDSPSAVDESAGYDNPENYDDGASYEDTTTTESTTTTTQVTTTLPPLEAAQAGLTETQAADQAGVDSVMDNWVPQVSSKYVGLEADGIIYDEISILQNHRNLVDRYSPTPVALLYSSDYSTFRNDDFWVSIALEPFSTPEGANGWCDQMGIPPDHCFAKFLSRTADDSGATVNR